MHAIDGKPLDRKGGSVMAASVDLVREKFWADFVPKENATPEQAEAAKRQAWRRAMERAPIGRRKIGDAEWIWRVPNKGKNPVTQLAVDVTVTCDTKPNVTRCHMSQQRAYASVDSGLGIAFRRAHPVTLCCDVTFSPLVGVTRHSVTPLTPHYKLGDVLCPPMK